MFTNLTVLLVLIVGKLQLNESLLIIRKPYLQFDSCNDASGLTYSLTYTLIQKNLSNLFYKYLPHSSLFKHTNLREGLPLAVSHSL